MSWLSEWLYPDAESAGEKKLKSQSQDLVLEGIGKARVRYDKYMGPGGFLDIQKDIAEGTRELEEEDLGTEYATQQLSIEDILNKIRGQQKAITKKTEFVGSQTGLDYSATVEDMNEVAQASIEDSIASAGEKSNIAYIGYRRGMKGQQLAGEKSVMDIDIKKQDTVDEMKSQLSSLLTGYHGATGEAWVGKDFNPSYRALIANTAEKFVPEPFPGRFT